MYLNGTSSVKKVDKIILFISDYEVQAVQHFTANIMTRNRFLEA